MKQDAADGDAVQGEVLASSRFMLLYGAKTVYYARTALGSTFNQEE